jgi:hypothetical protein
VGCGHDRLVGVDVTAQQTHTEEETDPWTINVGDHPQRADSPAYTRSRALMSKLVQQVQPWFLGDPPYQDHHGGGIWVKDDSGWMLLLGLAGVEWSAQFCADPAKLDLLRQYAKRVLAAFPQTIAGYEALGYNDASGLLSKTMSTADDIAAWTDGIFNASVPLPANQHTGVLPTGAGFHHYPKPIVDIELFKHDDFTLFVTDANGAKVAVTPVGPRGSGDGRVALAWAPEGSASHDAQQAAQQVGQQVVLPADSDLAKQAFAHQ